jgi:hypothetical protein
MKRRNLKKCLLAITAIAVASVVIAEIGPTVVFTPTAGTPTLGNCRDIDGNVIANEFCACQSQFDVATVVNYTPAFTYETSSQNGFCCPVYQSGTSASCQFEVTSSDGSMHAPIDALGSNFSMGTITGRTAAGLNFPADVGAETKHTITLHAWCAAHFSRGPQQPPATTPPSYYNPSLIIHFFGYNRC